MADQKHEQLKLEWGPGPRKEIKDDPKERDFGSFDKNGDLKPRGEE